MLSYSACQSHSPLVYIYTPHYQIPRLQQQQRDILQVLYTTEGGIYARFPRLHTYIYTKAREKSRLSRPAESRPAVKACALYEPHKGLPPRPMRGNPSRYFMEFKPEITRGVHAPWSAPRNREIAVHLVRARPAIARCSLPAVGVYIYCRLSPFFLRARLLLLLVPSRLLNIPLMAAPQLAFMTLARGV